MFCKERYAHCLHRHIKKSVPGIKVISDKLHCLESAHSFAGKYIGVICQALCFFNTKYNLVCCMVSGKLRVDRVRFISSFILMVVALFHAMFSSFPKTPCFSGTSGRWWELWVFYSSGKSGHRSQAGHLLVFLNSKS